MINVMRLVPRKVRREIAMNAGTCVVKLVLGVGCEVGTFVASKQIIKKIEDKEQKKIEETRNPMGFNTI